MKAHDFLRQGNPCLCDRRAPLRPVKSRGLSGRHLWLIRRVLELLPGLGHRGNSDNSATKPKPFVTRHGSDKDFGPPTTTPSTSRVELTEGVLPRDEKKQATPPLYLCLPDASGT